MNVLIASHWSCRKQVKGVTDYTLAQMYPKMFETRLPVLGRDNKMIQDDIISLS